MTVAKLQRIHLPRTLPLLGGSNVTNPRSANRYDRAEQGFFILRDCIRNMCAIVTRLALPHNHLCYLRLNTVGWSDTDTLAQLGIVLSHEHRRSVEELQNQVYQRYLDTQTFVRVLKQAGISRTTSVHTTSYETNEVAMVAVHA